LKKPLEKIDFEVFLASILLPRLFLFDPGNKKVPGIVQGLLFCSGEEKFIPTWIRIRGQFDLDENLINIPACSSELFRDLNIEEKFPFRCYKAVVEGKKDDLGEERSFPEILLRSIKRYY